MAAVNVYPELCVKMKQALEKDDPEALPKINAGWDINARDSEGNTILHHACEVKGEKCIAKIVSHANIIEIINARNSNGRTPFYIAAAFVVSNACLKLLIRAGAQPDLHPVERESALQTAIQCSFFPNFLSGVMAFEWLERIAIVMHGTLHSKSNYDLQVSCVLTDAKLPHEMVVLCAGYAHTGIERLVELVRYGGGARNSVPLEIVYQFESWEKLYGTGQWQECLERLHNLFVFASYSDRPGQLEAFEDNVVKIEEDKKQAVTKAARETPRASKD